MRCNVFEDFLADRARCWRNNMVTPPSFRQTDMPQGMTEQPQGTKCRPQPAFWPGIERMPRLA